jgi:Family of unknown function (DUF5762)
MTTSGNIWYDDVPILWEKPLEFYPKADTTSADQINALVRLIIYVTIILYIYKRNIRIVYFGAAAVAILSLAYRGRGGIFAGGGGGSVGLSGGGLSNTADAARACRPSTATNPFANTLVTEYQSGELPAPPCTTGASFETFNKQADTFFHQNLPRDVEDTSDRANSQRQFVTMPTAGNPPDTVAFAKMLQANVRNCKTDNSQCLPTMY